MAPAFVAVAPVCRWLAQGPVFFPIGSSLAWACWGNPLTHSPKLGSQKPGQNRNYVCKKAGNFIELSFLFSREAKESEQLDQEREKKAKEAWPRERRAGSGRARESRGQAPGGRGTSVPSSSFSPAGTSSSLLLWVPKRMLGSFKAYGFLKACGSPKRGCRNWGRR